MWSSHPLLFMLLSATAAAVAAGSLAFDDSDSRQQLHIYVHPAGNDGASGLVVGSPLRTCAAAIARLKASPPTAGATVHFAAGLYELNASTSCGNVSLHGTAAAPFVLAGDPTAAAGGGGTHFDGMQLLDATQLKPVHNATIEALINPQAKGKLLVMPLASRPKTLEWGGTPLTESIWPNPSHGSGLGYVEKVYDKGAAWSPDTHTPGVPKPTGTRSKPVGANFSVSEQPTGRWELEMEAGPGFGDDVFIRGYFSADWFNEVHQVARIEQSATETTIQIVDSSWYGFLEAVEGGHEAGGACGAPPCGPPGRFTMIGLLSNVDFPGEWFYDPAAAMLYVFPPVEAPSGGCWQTEDLARVRLGQWDSDGLLRLINSSHVTVRDFTVSGTGVGTMVLLDGGHHNTVGGCTFKNSAATAVGYVGGHFNAIVGNDIYDVVNHLGAVAGNPDDNLHNLRPSNNQVANNHFTNVYLAPSVWGVTFTGTGARFSHNLVHDSPRDALDPGGWGNPMQMIDHNEFMNTGYAVGDGGVMYVDASQVQGYGMHVRENFIHHALDTPQLKVRNGLLFDDHFGGLSNCSGNVLYKACTTGILGNGGSNHNITRNLIVNSGTAIVNIAESVASDDIARLPKLDNGTACCRGSKSDYIWNTEQQLGVTSYEELFQTPFAKRWPSFAEQLRFNSTSRGWASPAGWDVSGNVVLNCSKRICLNAAYWLYPNITNHANNRAMCDEELANWTRISKEPFMNGLETIVEGSWEQFPDATGDGLEFINPTLKFDTRHMGLRCDGFRRSMPSPTLYRPWVKAAFAGVSSHPEGETYTPAAAAARAACRSGKALVLNFTRRCPPLEKQDCRAIWLAWGECQADGQQVWRYTVEDEPLLGGNACEHEDGFAQAFPCCAHQLKTEPASIVSTTVKTDDELSVDKWDADADDEAVRNGTMTMSQFGWYFVSDVSELPQVAPFSTSIFVGNGGNVLTKTCTDVYAPCAVPLLAAADIQNLTSLAEWNMTAIMNGIETIFQSDVKTLLPDWRQRWYEYWDLVRPHAKHILAWYPMDEPPHTWPPTGAYKNMTKLIKATSPSIPIAATVSPSIVRGLEYAAYDLPPEVDWVGFDSYNCWQWNSFLGSDPAEFGCFDNRSVPHNLQVVDSYAKKRGGKMFSVADALTGWNQSVVGYHNETAQKIKAGWDTQMFAFCALSPRCVGMFPFLWNSVGKPQQAACCMGVKDAMHEVLLPALSKMGIAVKHGAVPTLMQEPEFVKAAAIVSDPNFGKEPPRGSPSVPLKIDEPEGTISVAWGNVTARSHATATVHTPNSYAWQRTDPRTGKVNPMHDVLYSRLAALGTDHIRYMQAQDGNGLSNLSAYPEPFPPNHAAKTTSWDMAGIDAFVSDFCAATKGGDCSETIVFIGPLPPWFFHPTPTSSAVCNATDSKLCTGPLIDPTGQQAGEYYSRIVSWFTKGFLIDEMGATITGGHFFNFTYWEVLNEPNLYAHYNLAKPSMVAEYTTIYDGITSVMHRDHPALQYAAMCWAGIPDNGLIQHFMNESNHDATAVWPPAFVTFHIYDGPGTVGSPVGLSPAIVAAAQEVVEFVATSSGGRTRSFVDEMGIFGCAPINYTTVLDTQPNRFAFHNPRAAWFAAAYGQLASIGVDAMGSSQFFGYDGITGKANNWPHGGGDSVHDFWYYPCLSALDWTTGKPNARYYAVQMLFAELGGSQMKAVSPAVVVQPPLPSPPPPPPKPPLPPPPAPVACPTVRNVTENQGILGQDMGSLTHQSWAKNATLGFEQCVAACCRNPGCAGMMYQQFSQGDGYRVCTTGKPCCWLKFATGPWDPRPQSEHAKTGILRAHGVPPKPQPPPPPPPPTNALLAFGFSVAGSRRVLLVNTGTLTATVAVAGAGGARHTFINEAHGHGDIPPGRETLDSKGSLAVDGYGISVLTLATKTDDSETGETKLAGCKKNPWLPEPSWIPQLERFIVGGSCNRKVRLPRSTSPNCVSRTWPNASMGPVQGVPSWRPGDGPDCSISDGARGDGTFYNVACAMCECASTQMHWWPFHYSKHNYPCCSNKPAAVETVRFKNDDDSNNATVLFESVTIVGHRYCDWDTCGRHGLDREDATGVAFNDDMVLLVANATTMASTDGGHTFRSLCGPPPPASRAKRPTCGNGAPFSPVLLGEVGTAGAERSPVFSVNGSFPSVRSLARGLDAWTASTGTTPTTRFKSKANFQWSIDPVTKSFLPPREVTGPHMFVEWSGLPHPTAEFWPGSGGLATLPSGVMVAIVPVWGHPPGQNQTVASFCSHDDGATFVYTNTVASIGSEARAGRNESEGPNECNLVTLKDGRLWAVMRVDGGDGVHGHSHRPYVTSTSMDGVTWSPAEALPDGMGSAWPRAAVLADGTLLLSGGRPALNLWISSDSAKTWTAYDIPSIHNKLTPPKWNFCPEFLHANRSLGWAESSGYTWIGVLGAGKRTLLCYERQGVGSGGYSGKQPPNCNPKFSTIFCMHLVSTTVDQQYQLPSR